MTVIALPPVLSSKRLPGIGGVFDQSQAAIRSHDDITFDFSHLRFIEPFGYTSVFNLIRWLRAQDVRISFKNFRGPNRSAIAYLDDCGFFQFFGVEDVRDGSSLRSTTISEVISPTQRHGWYDSELVTWLAQRTGKPTTAFGELKVCFLELFQNIQDHSKSNKGAVFAQHYPNLNKLIISISDIGIGIPETVRVRLPNLSDVECIEKACEMGFTSGSTAGNAGRGLANLTDIIVGLYHGQVRIVSLSGYYEKSYQSINKNALTWSYPGTSIEITVDTTRLPESPLEVEDFEW
jgi:hypothetical protein